MKKTLLLVAACATLFSCQQKGATSEAAANDSLAMDTLYFEGVVPAADGPGIRYEIALAQDGTNVARIAETYLEGNEGKDTTYLYEGMTETVDVPALGEGAKGIKFTTANGDAYHFWMKNDSTISLVNSEWEASPADSLYTLKRK